jgi:hypothetical protein
MNDYGITQWVDYARGVVPAAERERMQRHLAGGCRECREMAEFCEKVSRTGAAMMRIEVPESAVRQVKAIFPPRAKTAKRSFLLPAQLIFDSFLSPVPAGLRASWQVGWQGLYKAGDCSLDLRIEPELKTSRAAVIGQITSATLPESEMTNVPVFLKSGKNVVASTVSNRFGEFQIEYEQQARLQLCVYLEGGAKRIQVSLKKLTTDNPIGGNRFKLGSRRKESGSERN